MNAIKTVHLVYFSGTGGTARIAECFEKSFSGHSIEVVKTQLSTKEQLEQNTDLLVLLFPVYAFNAPKPIDEWINRTRQGNGCPAVVISISGGGEVSPNTACRVNVIKQLEKKGYSVYYESMFVMPSNIFISYSDELAAMILRAIPLKTEKTVSDILSGKNIRTRPLLFDRMFSKLGLIEKKLGGRIFGGNLKATDACIGCSRCAEKCPRGNITMLNKKPVFGNKCIICLRCVYDCPKSAIVPGIGKVAVLKGGYNLNALETRTNQKTDFPPVSQIAKGYLFKGVREYLDDTNLNF